MEYKPLSKTMCSKLAALKLKKHRDNASLFIAEGNKCVADTLGYFNAVYIVATTSWLASNKFDAADTVVYEASQEAMKRLSSLATPPDVITYYRRPEFLIDEEIIRSDITLLLDGVQDPGNLGTIIRLADWFGVRQIIASPISADIFNTKCIQASMGSISRVKVFYRDLPLFVANYKEIPVVGLLLDGENIYTASLPSPAFIVMGNEGNGLSQQMRRIVDRKLLIPSYPPGQPTGDSLNVAMATAITLSEFRRRQ